MRSRQRRELTEEERKEMWKVEPRSLEWQLGFMYGEVITLKYIPCLSIDMLKTNRVIEVSEEEASEYNSLHNYWFEKLNLYENREEGHKNTKDEWDAQRLYNKKLMRKYMPPILECKMQRVHNVTNWQDFKDGMSISLWDSDVCCYDTNNIDISEKYWFTIIKMKLSE